MDAMLEKATRSFDLRYNAIDARSLNQIENCDFRFGIKPFGFKFSCCYRPTIHRLELPPEVVRYIYMYLHVTSAFDVSFTRDYPFKPMRWSAADGTQLSRSLSESQNNMHQQDYSPALSPEMDCVLMIERFVRVTLIFVQPKKRIVKVADE